MLIGGNIHNHSRLTLRPRFLFKHISVWTWIMIHSPTINENKFTELFLGLIDCSKIHCTGLRTRHWALQATTEWNNGSQTATKSLCQARSKILWHLSTRIIPFHPLKWLRVMRYATDNNDNTRILDMVSSYVKCLCSRADKDQDPHL